MLWNVVYWGLAAGIIHFIAIGILYGNPWIDRLYVRAQEAGSVRRWSSKGRYLGAQFLGTQIEIFLLTLAFVWLRPHVSIAGLGGSLAIGAMLAAIRVYPRFWNMWIQTSYPRPLLLVEAVNGTLGTMIVALTLHFLSA